MPYQGPYPGQYANFTPYDNAQYSLPQHHPNGVQYPVQQYQQPVQPTGQQRYPAPISVDIYSKQYYHPQQQHARPAPQPAQYSPQQAGYPQGHVQQPQYSPPSAPPTQAEWQQAPQLGHSYQTHAAFQQQNGQPQQSQHQQYPQFQQQPRTQGSPSWQNQRMAANQPAPIVSNHVDARSRPLGQLQPQPAVPPQLPRHVPAITSSTTVSHQHAPSSPDPLAPSPKARQVRPGQTQANQQRQQQQSRPRHASESVQPKPTAIPNPNLHPSQHRVASHVEIPVMPQPTKRRRSNDSQPVAVCQEPSVDYQAALLALSDEYIDAAYSLRELETDEESKQYHALIATGIACLESVLKNYRHQDARKEARIRLRLASLLVEETENDTEAEETLSKGIALCEQNRLTDLKYAMHHLLVRLLFKNSPKTALKATEKLIGEVGALQLLPWIYAFRFLRVCFGLQLSSPSEHTAMLKQLSAISATAEEHRHISVKTTAATVEAMVYIRSGTCDAVDLAQRAMATARTHQLGPEMQKMPQIRALLDCLDLSCSLLSYDPKQTPAKMSQMHNGMDPATRQPGWTKEGTVHIDMLPSSNNELELDTLGIMRTSDEGMASLCLRWMSQSGIYVVGYLLSGITYMHKNEDHKSAGFLEEGLKLNKKSALDQDQRRSLSDRTIAHDQRLALDTAARLLIISDCCVRFDWKMAQQGIAQARAKFAERSSEIDEEATRMLLYLDAVCKQARGELHGALQLYQSPALVFEPDIKLGNAERDIRVLSALNSVMILRTLGTEEADRAGNLHAAVEPYCLNHLNKSFTAAYYMTKATADGSKSAIIKTKQYLQAAVNAARSAANNQLLFIVMNVMTDLFFQGIIGEQAEKSAQAARSLAKKGDNKLWLCVADNMYGEIKERCGKVEEAEAARKEGMSVLKTLPDDLKGKLVMEADV